MSVIVDPTTLTSIPLAGMISFVPETADLEDNLSLYIPQNLPPGRISTQEFDLWKHDLLSYLRGEKVMSYFLTAELPYNFFGLLLVNREKNICVLFLKSTFIT